MARGKAFVDVLDEVLAGYAPGEPARSPRMSPGYATPSLFCFESIEITLSRSPLPSLSAPNRVTTPQPGPARSPRPLSPRQREAFDAFVQLGARISDDFTDAELRSMFRSLALRYHPDRHPGGSDDERAQLSVCFAQLHDAYESLKSVSVCSN